MVVIVFIFAAPVQIKELTFTSGIASHDLTTKLKQAESWLEKKHHVRMTLRSGRRDSAVNLVRKNAHMSCLLLDGDSREPVQLTLTRNYVIQLGRSVKYGYTADVIA